MGPEVPPVAAAAAAAIFSHDGDSAAAAANRSTSSSSSPPSAAASSSFSAQLACVSTAEAMNPHRRCTMEDVTVFVPAGSPSWNNNNDKKNVAASGSSSSWNYCAVYDGHGGAYAIRTAADAAGEPFRCCPCFLTAKRFAFRAFSDSIDCVQAGTWWTF
jgi:hypothetical protein